MVEIKSFPFDKINGDLFEAAQAYAAAGLSVLPLHYRTQQGACSCLNKDCPSPAKHPLTVHGLNDASCDLATITRWWGQWPQANIGVVTGNGLTVVDVDGRTGGFETLQHLNLPETSEVATGNGFHKWYKSDLPIKSGAGKLGKGIDVKGEGGYVVAPPSVHITGRIYTFTNRVSIAEFPGLSNLIIGNHPQSPRTTPLEPDPLIVRDPTILPDNVVQGPGNSRHNWLVSEAGKVRSRGALEPEIYAWISVLNQYRVRPSKPDAEIRKIAQSVAKYAPSTSFLIAESINEEMFGNRTFNSDFQPIIDRYKPKPRNQTPNTAPNVETVGATPPAKPAYRLTGFMSAGELLKTVFETPEEILTGLYRGEFGGIVSKPSMGKSTLMKNISICLATGLPFYNLIPPGLPPLRVVYIDMEDIQWKAQRDLLVMFERLTFKQREICETNLEIAHHPRVNDERLIISNKGHLKNLILHLKDLEPALVIFDTLAQVSGLISENDNAEMQRKVVNPALEITEKTEAAVLMIHHQGKDKSEGGRQKGEVDGQFASRGASSLPAAFRWQLNIDPVTPDKRNPMRVWRSKDKTAIDLEPLTLSINRETRWCEIVQEPERPIIPTVEGDLIKIFQDQPAGTGLTINQLEAYLPNTPRRTIQRKVADLLEMGQATQIKRGMYTLTRSNDAPL